MDDSEYESLPTEKVTVHLAAGAMAGVMEHCVMYPVDCVKVRSIYELRILKIKRNQIEQFTWVKHGFCLQ